MAFQRVGGSRKYFKYKECSPGDVLVKEGVYTGSEEGKFGIQHLFKQGGEVICLNSSGHLNWLVDNHLTTGLRCNVIYDGSEVLTKGPMKGKEAHKFILEVDTPDGAVAHSEVEPEPVATKRPAAAVEDDITI